jgi:hypothetical protein
MAHRFVAVLVASSLLLAASCSRLTEPEGETRTRGIIGGTSLVPDGTTHVLINIGQPGTTNRRTCSGELLRGDWVLTARHCVHDAAVAVVSVDTATQRSAAAELVLHPALDVALIRLALPISVSSAGTTFPQELFPGPIASLDGQPVQCFGYGRNTVSGGGGLLRSAALTVHTTFNPNFLVVYANGLGQIPWSGDSGGSCQLTHGGRPYLSGVFSTCTALLSPYECHLVAAPTIAPWVQMVLQPQPDAAAAADKAAETPDGGRDGGRADGGRADGGSADRPG